MKYDLEVPDSFSTKEILGFILPLVVVSLTFLGYVISPRNENGRTVLYSPQVAQIVAYQRKVRTWALELQPVQDGLDFLLTRSTDDLLVQDSLVNQYYNQLIRLHEEVDSTQAPQTLTALHDAVVASVNAYFDAVEHTANWISALTDSNHTQAQDALQKASELLDQVNENPWVQP